MKKLNLIIVLIVIVIVIMAIIKSANTPVTTPTYDSTPRIELQNLKYDIYMRAQNSILEVLKAPSTAQFPSYFKLTLKNTVSNYDSLYIVKSYVDSQNSYGAMIRSDYEVRAIYMHGTWTLLSVEFDGQKIY